MQEHDFRDLVERIKLRSPIEGVVGERVADLRRRGALHWARCPFHEERTPSFAVDPRKGTWRCYGACGEGGDVLSFVQRFDGLSFLDALRLLGQAVGEEVPERFLRKRSKGDEERLARLYEILSRAERLYARTLWSDEGREALAYARGRGFTDETLSAFRLGWAPSHGNPLVSAAGASGVPLELLVETGLAKRAEDGRPFDFFRGRLVIPIADRLGRTVGFGGRHLPGDTKALGKYVNTPETRLFHKGRLVFGLDRAAEAARRSRHLVLVEGYTDVLAAHQAGVPNVAAVLGTSTTEDHAALVRRAGVERVTLVFDGDEAGRRASTRALLGLLPLGIRLDVAMPPPGEDPADLLLAEGGAEAFTAMLDGARDWFPWRADELAGLGGGELARAVDELFRLLVRVPRPVEQDARLVELARGLHLSEAALRRQWEASRAEDAPRARSARAPEAAPSAEAPPGTDPRELEAFRCLLGALLVDNSLIPVYGDWVPRCPEGDLRTIFRAVVDLYENGEEGEPVHAGAVMTRLADHPARERVVALEELARSAARTTSPLELAHAQKACLERLESQRKVSELHARLGALDAQDVSETNALLRSLHSELRRARVPFP